MTLRTCTKTEVQAFVKVKYFGDCVSLVLLQGQSLAVWSVVHVFRVCFQCIYTGHLHSDKEDTYWYWVTRRINAFFQSSLQKSELVCAKKTCTWGYHFLVTILWDHSKIFETWQPLNELYILCMGQISDGDCLFHCRPSRRLTQTRRKKTSTRWRANMDSAPQKRNEHCHEHLKPRTSSTSNAISNVNIHLLIFVLFWPFKFLSPSLG